MNTLCEDSAELASSAVEVDLVKSPANSTALAAEDQLEPGLTVHEVCSSHFLGVEHASVSFGKARARVFALRDVSLMFERGTLSLVMGPSGSGKTTLLSMLGCLLSPDEGSVFVDDVAVNQLAETEKTAVRQKKIGFVFQAFRLFRPLSPIDNVSIRSELPAPT